jgi:hypothetical protein
MTLTSHLTTLPGPIMNTDFFPVDDNGTAFSVRSMHDYQRGGRVEMEAHVIPRESAK